MGEAREYLEKGKSGSERFFEAVGDLGFGAEGDRAVGFGQSEAFADPEGLAARIGREDTKVQVLHGAGACGLFQMTQQGGSGTRAAGEGGDHHQAEIGIMGRGVAKSNFSQRDQARLCGPISKQAEAQALDGVATGGRIGKVFLGHQRGRGFAAFHMDIVSRGCEEGIDQGPVGLRDKRSDQHG